MIEFRPLTVASDIDLVHGWMQQAHVVPWWGLEGPRDGVRDYLFARVQIKHRDLWIVSDGATPVAYVETFVVAQDPLAERYDSQPGDRGFELLVGPPERLGDGTAQRVVRRLVTVLLNQSAITRVVCACDERNTRLLAFCRALGAQDVASLDGGLPATLLGWTSAAQLGGAGGLLQQPRQPAVLEHLAARLLVRAVAHDVVLVVDGLDRRAAARARLAGLAVDLQRQRQLVGDRQLDDLLVVLERAVERRRRSPRAAPRASSSSRSLPRLNGDSRAVHRISSTHERPMPAMTRWSRSSVCSGRGAFSSGAQVVGRLAARPPGPSVAIDLVVVERVGAQQLHPRRLLRAELAQAQLAPAVGREPQQQPRRAVAQPGALVVELQAPGAHEVHEQREVAGDVDDEVLAAPPHAGDRAARRAPAAADRTSSAR